MKFKTLLTLVKLVLHKLIYPYAHLDVVLQHDNNHTVLGETEIIFLNSEHFQLSVQLAQLIVAFLYDIE